MLYILVPKDHFLALDYPYMEDYILGLPIPIAWGDVHDIVPFLIDTDYLIYKVVGHAIADITEIRSKGVPLGAGSFIPDLPNGEFELAGTPWLAAGGATYYFAISADYAINGTDYLVFTKNARMTGFAWYEINGASVWTDPGTRQIRFSIRGKTRLDGEEDVYLNGVVSPPIGSTPLRDAAARTRIGSKFVNNGVAFYVTRVSVWVESVVGAPTGNLKVTFFSAIAPEVQQGIEGDNVPIEPGPFNYELTLPQYGEDNDLHVDIESPDPMLTIAADVLESLCVDRLGKDPSILDAAYLAAFAAARYQELKVFVDREMTVGDFIGKMEASVLFKFLPLQDGTYATIIFAAGEPAGTPHFRDEDFVEGSEFRIDHDLSVVRHMTRIKYDENPATQEFKVAEMRSNYARLFYSNEETIEIETWLKEDTDAEDLAETYSRFFEKPQTRITFEVHGFGLNLLPGRDKVKITRSRAAWTGGAINGELFRIMKITKKPATNSSEISAVLDSETY